MDVTDNELITLEMIHQYVEVLDRYFGNVCELDLIFNFHKVHLQLPRVLLSGSLSILIGGGRERTVALDSAISCKNLSILQAYFMLDEMLLAGQLQEPSKKVRAFSLPSQHASASETSGLPLQGILSSAGCHKSN